MQFFKIASVYHPCQKSGMIPIFKKVFCISQVEFPKLFQTMSSLTSLSISTGINQLAKEVASTDNPSAGTYESSPTSVVTHWATMAQSKEKPNSEIERIFLNSA
jgi:hypothetical protein